MKKLTVVLLASFLGGSPGIANAADYKNTISVGYAYANLSGWIPGNAHGGNIKYNWENLDSGFGAVGSVTHVAADIYNYGINLGTANSTSVLVGPSYRFNEYLSIYAMLGGAKGQVKENSGYTSSRTSFVWGVGFQVNPIKHFAINAAYERASFSVEDIRSSKLDVGTFIIGGGYSF